MDSSSRNAGEMLDRLTLTYNRSRSLPSSFSHRKTHFLLFLLACMCDLLAHCHCISNRTRQAAITTELIEIISGASALEG